MKKKQFTNEEISGLCLGLAMLLKAGVATGDGFTLMAEDESDKETKELLMAMAAGSDEGKGLPAVFRESGAFPAYVSGLLEVGERTGRMEEALTALADYYEERLRMERQIRTSLLYPAVLLLIMLVVIVVLLVKVLPVFDQVYGQMGSSLTGIAGGLLAFGQVLGKAMPALCVIMAVALAGLGAFAASSGFRGKVLSWWNRHRGTRGVSAQINTARAAQVLAMGLRSGLKAEEALGLAADMMDEVPSMAQALRECSREIGAGAGLVSSLKKYNILPPAECRLLEVGMRSGSGDTIMEEIAGRLLETGENSLAEKIGRVEPALVVVTSVLIGLILLSVMLPLVHIMAAIN